MAIRLTGISHGINSEGKHYNLIIEGPLAASDGVVWAQGKQFHVVETVEEIEALMAGGRNDMAGYTSALIATERVLLDVYGTLNQIKHLLGGTGESFAAEPED